MPDKQAINMDENLRDQECSLKFGKHKESKTRQKTTKTSTNPADQDVTDYSSIQSSSSSSVSGDTTNDKMLNILKQSR